MTTKSNIFLKTTSALFICALLSGCASTWHPKNPDDPYEDYNRKVFKFNRGVDKYVYKPIAKGYNAIMPDIAQRGVRNVLSNIDDIPVVANDVLQLNGLWMIQDSARFVVNTTVGIVGLFDVATKMGLKKHNQDFGLTMAKWGVRKSPYFIFPFLPPSTARDFFGFGLDQTVMNPLFYVKPRWIDYTASGVDIVQTRADLLSSDKLVDQAFDPYIFVRDAYLQNRRAKIERVVNPDASSELAPSSSAPVPVGASQAQGENQTQAP